MQPVVCTCKYYIIREPSEQLYANNGGQGKFDVFLTTNSQDILFTFLPLYKQTIKSASVDNKWLTALGGAWWLYQYTK